MRSYQSQYDVSLLIHTPYEQAVPQPKIPIKYSILQLEILKEILLKLNLPDHRILKDGGEDFCYFDTVRLSRSDEVLKLKNFKKDATLKLFKSTNQERYEHVSPEVTSSQDGKMRLYLVDDLKVFKITFKTCYGTSSRPKVYDHYIKSQVKD
ncbi:hypothetical protein Tco_0643857 [Tanacetum coccineum]